MFSNWFLSFCGFYHKRNDCAQVSFILSVLLLHPHPLPPQSPSLSLWFMAPASFFLPPKRLMVLMLEVWLYLYLYLSKVLHSQRSLLIISVSFICSYFFYPALKCEFSLSLFPLPFPQFVLCSWVITFIAQYWWLELFIIIKTSLLCSRLKFPAACLIFFMMF